MTTKYEVVFINRSDKPVRLGFTARKTKMALYHFMMQYGHVVIAGLTDDEDDGYEWKNGEWKSAVSVIRFSGRTEKDCK